MPRTITVEPCRAGFEHCVPMREEEAKRHPRTPRLRECRHMPIPPERPERLQGPEVGTEWIYRPKSGSRHDGRRVEVIARSYVWAPGDPSYGGGARHYDWKVIRFLDGDPPGSILAAGGLVVDDDELEPAHLCRCAVCGRVLDA